MAKLTFDPKAHFDPYKEDRDRQAYERGLERKDLHNMARVSGPGSIASRQHRHKPKPVTLAPVSLK